MNGEHKITTAGTWSGRRWSMCASRRWRRSASTPSRPPASTRWPSRRCALGWPRSDVEVIDADLGVSGRSTEGRDGFRELVAGCVWARSARSSGWRSPGWPGPSADLSRLLELARLTDTLLIDADGVYDLADFNDRLLLGLKGTMSEAELHLLAGRLQGAKRAAAARGELRTPLPVGYVHDDDGRHRDRPGRGGRGRGRRRVRRVHRDRLGLRGGRRVRRAAVPAARLRRRVGRAAALGPAHPRPGAGHPEQPLLRRRLRVRPLPLPPHRRPDGSIHTGITDAADGPSGRS